MLKRVNLELFYLLAKLYCKSNLGFRNLKITKLLILIKPIKPNVKHPLNN